MKKDIYIIILLLVVVFSTNVKPLVTSADVIPTGGSRDCLPEICFGGTIIKKDFKWCLIKIPSFPFVVPNPVAPYFYMTHVLQPGDAINTVPFLHKFYDVPILSTEKLRYRPAKGVQTLGAYIPGASEAFRQTCTFNRDRLPKAPTESFGLLDFWGTGCLALKGEIAPLPNSKCVKLKK